ncbi:pirin-like [Dreissena polymorpha]|uniref:Pirin n=1 Tax=Dreissena polymorpha TaxID=45954 RepID=A0A9D3YUH9_DREPO|nr:pirin-like [Dreissena polymorpha]XP_052254368.1 pirin-like [Dreissena polymorpha]XP_052254369.1 pirin-like [Dreissena polymorpha]XP_052255437.1 pirin-like [Dreissena polymorpha]KAH3705043.1 hypothetical protein DPMN_080106 [Dreissena polymorpha]KAH3705084.1 hypothetical protein DPMN_080148 [Dreissena polymorpha]
MATSLRAVRKVYTGHKQREGGGFIVRRALGGSVPLCDPFLMLDHFGPITYAPGEALGAPDHPHRGFETVSYVISGEMCHKDSQGNTGNLGPGWVQWMTAGSGVVHAEMPSENTRKHGGTVEGFQLWVNLLAKDKMIPPRYQDTPPDKIPVAMTTDKRVVVKVIAGESLGTRASISTRTPIMYLDILLTPGSEFTQHVPERYDGFIYVRGGKATIGKVDIEFGQTAILAQGTDVKIENHQKEECRLLLIAGEPLREPVVQHGPFVMNTEQQITQAIEDYRKGKLGEIPGADERRRETEAAKRTQKSTGTWDRS